MARPRSPNSIEAERLYNDGMKLVDIAKKIGVPSSTVRRWKSTQKWDAYEGRQIKKNKNERSDKSKTNVQKTKGAPKGNKNAVGHASSTPKRNKNAETHGAYSKIYWDSLDNQEIDLIDNMDDNEEQHLIMQLQMFSVRERRLMKNIAKYREIEENNHGLSVESVSKTKKVEDITDIEGKNVGSGKYKKIQETTVTHTKAVLNAIMALETELTKVQRAKTRTLETLAKIRLENKRFESNTIIDNEEFEAVQIYIPYNGRDKQ